VIDLQLQAAHEDLRFVHRPDERLQRRRRRLRRRVRQGEQRAT
jgi:hypothetical protein